MIVRQNKKTVGRVIFAVRLFFAISPKCPPYSQPFFSAMPIASIRFLASSFWIASDK